MVTRRIFQVAQFKTASRHWLPVNSRAYFSSRQRAVNFNNISEGGLIANDDVFSSPVSATAAAEETETFEPTVHSSDDVITAGPVNRV